MKANVPVEVSRDTLGWLLIYSASAKECGVREGEPVGEPDYFKSQSAAKKAAAKHNASLK